MASFAERHQIPMLGAGLQLRPEIYEEVLYTKQKVDWLEVPAEGFLAQGSYADDVLERCLARWPLLPHANALDLGGQDPLEREFVGQLAALTARLRAPLVSDHASFTRLSGMYLHEQVPLPFTEEAASHLAGRIKVASSQLGVPLLIENPPVYERMPEGTLEEPAFLSRVLGEADCGLLLDVTNLYVGGQNHGYDPLDYLEALPLDRVALLHVGGYEDRFGTLVATHARSVAAPVWELFEQVVKRTGPLSTCLEWDVDVPAVEALLEEAERIRKALGTST